MPFGKGYIAQNTPHHSLAQIWKNQFFFFSEGCIFFPRRFLNIFPEKFISWSKSQNPLKILKPEKKYNSEKKTQFLLTHSILSESDTKVKNGKKYGIFAPPHVFFWELGIPYQSPNNDTIYIHP